MIPKILVCILMYLIHHEIRIVSTEGQSLNSLLNSVLRNSSNKLAVEKDWQEDPESVLVKFLESLQVVNSADFNATMISWQLVHYNNTWNHEETLNSIQLVIPLKSSAEETNIKRDDSEDNEDTITKIKETREEFETIKKMGLPLFSISATNEEFDEDGQRNFFLYMDEEQLFVKERNKVAFLNKTTKTSQQKVYDFIDNLKPTILGTPSILRYDTDGSLIEDQSVIEPHVLVKLTDHYKAPDDVFLTSPKIVAQITEQYPKEEIPKQLALEFNKEFSEYTWRVLVDEPHDYIKKDVSVTLTNQNFGLNDTVKVSYFIYGISKQ